LGESGIGEARDVVFTLVGDDERERRCLVQRCSRGRICACARQCDGAKNMSGLRREGV
jgi:hypothetical protein